MNWLKTPSGPGRVHALTESNAFMMTSARARIEAADGHFDRLIVSGQADAGGGKAGPSSLVFQKLAERRKLDASETYGSRETNTCGPGPK
jgi:hypothetical protein